MQTALKFLSSLKKNNNREWFNANKEMYETALNEFKAFIHTVHKAIAKTDSIEAPKVFRIYRDLRFSKDKIPFKTNFGAYFSRTNAGSGGYYFHLEPGNTFSGGGVWHPEKEELFRIRKELEYNPADIKKIINAPAFKKYFGEIQGDELKNLPKGFDKEAEAANLIKKKDFLLLKKYTDKEAAASDFSKEIIDVFKVAKPFLSYMSDVLSTDLNGEPVV